MDPLDVDMAELIDGQRRRQQEAEVEDEAMVAGGDGPQEVDGADSPQVTVKHGDGQKEMRKEENEALSGCLGEMFDRLGFEFDEKKECLICGRADLWPLCNDAWCYEMASKWLGTCTMCGRFATGYWTGDLFFCHKGCFARYRSKTRYRWDDEGSWKEAKFN